MLSRPRSSGATPRGEWIRLPSVIWAAMLFTNVFIILFDELRGIHATPHPWVVVAANASWMIVPAVGVWRMARSEHPFTEEVAAGASA